MQFASRGQNLLNLSDKLASAFVPKLVVFSVDDWRQNQKRLQQELKKAFGSEKELVVRSSCHSEDNLQSSNAGAFLSVSGVKACSVASAINRVIESYGVAEDRDEIIVQRMVQDVFFFRRHFLPRSE